MKKLFAILAACVLCTTGCGNKINEDIVCSMNQDTSMYTMETGIKMSVEESVLKKSVITVDLEYTDTYAKYYDDNAFQTIKTSLDAAYAKFKDYSIDKTEKGVKVEVRLSTDELLSFIGISAEENDVKNITKDDIADMKKSIEASGYKCK